jgi:hypothetical protein
MCRTAVFHAATADNPILHEEILPRHQTQDRRCRRVGFRGVNYGVTYEKVEAIIAAMTSWLISSDREDSQLLVLDAMTLTTWLLRSIRRLDRNALNE